MPQGVFRAISRLKSAGVCLAPDFCRWRLSYMSAGLRSVTRI